jgi:hypothetical protein
LNESGLPDAARAVNQEAVGITYRFGQSSNLHVLTPFIGQRRVDSCLG